MKNNFTLKTTWALMLSLFLCASNINAQLPTLYEGFDSVPPPGWVVINHSHLRGTTSWFQGSPVVFPSHSGDSSSYAGANFNNTKAVGTISDWLISPVLILRNGAVLKFWTRTVAGSTFPDRLEVRVSISDTSTAVGIGSMQEGNFARLIRSINPNLKKHGYPEQWTEYVDTINNLPGKKDTALGRIAFRYFVINAGALGTNSNYIGLDDVSYDAGTLPVSFINFDGVLRNGQAILNWSTANEINNKGFEVQKSLDGQTFAAIGFVQGAGSSSNVSNYSFTDAKLLSGSDYYRLKQIDLDGRFSYSSVIKLDFTKFDWAILGNPVTNNSWVQLQLDKPANVSLQIISLNGKIMEIINKGNISAGTYTVPLNLSNAAPGMYVIKMIVNNQIFSMKVIK
ncbi:MAG: choice-of-anchor J domain-containing protein [Chitinophagaceae bacterium]